MNAAKPDAPRALVVDDDDAVRMLMCMVLEDSGFQIEEASTGEEAMRACYAGMPDYIFLDAVLPDADGFDLCRHMRDLPGGRAIPIMMVTGLEPVQAQRLAKRVDASACIAKPIDVSSLQKLAERLLRQRG